MHQKFRNSHNYDHSVLVFYFNNYTKIETDGRQNYKIPLHSRSGSLRKDLIFSIRIRLSQHISYRCEIHLHIGNMRRWVFIMAFIVRLQCIQLLIPLKYSRTGLPKVPTPMKARTAGVLEFIILNLLFLSVAYGQVNYCCKKCCLSMNA